MGYIKFLSMMVFSSSLSEQVPASDTHWGQLVIGLSAGIHEGLGDNGQRGIYYLSDVHVEDEVRVFQDVNPESQGQTASTHTHTPSPPLHTVHHT